MSDIVRDVVISLAEGRRPAQYEVASAFEAILGGELHRAQALFAQHEIRIEGARAIYVPKTTLADQR